MIKLDQKGITLIELLVAVGIFLLLAIGAVELLLWGLRGRSVIWEQLSTQNEGRKIVQDFVNELRRADVSSIGAYPLEFVDAQQIIFYSNIDNDSWRERVRYFLTDKTLKKGITKPAGNPLAYNSTDELITDIVHNVANGTSSLFFYYDQNYSGVTGTPLSLPVNIAAVRLVEIHLMLEENPNLTPAPFFIESRAAIRNLKSN